MKDFEARLGGSHCPETGLLSSLRSPAPSPSHSPGATARGEKTNRGLGAACRPLPTQAGQGLRSESPFSVAGARGVWVLSESHKSLSAHTGRAGRGALEAAQCQLRAHRQAQQGARTGNLGQGGFAHRLASRCTAEEGDSGNPAGLQRG